MMDFGATHGFKHILLTGMPGIGKTTVCKKFIELIGNTDYSYDGFYTEEIRSEDHRRIGFDVIPVKNTECSSGILARIGSALGEKKISKIRVGNYYIFVNEFERVALPRLASQTDILIIDEIGKMELFSKRFHDCIEELFWSKVDRNKPMCIVATIPDKNRIPQHYSKLFEKFYQDGNCKIMNVNIQNRSNLPETLLNIITNSIMN